MQEYVQGQLKNRYGDAFIRGNNGRANHCKANTATRQSWPKTTLTKHVIACSSVHQYYQAMMLPKQRQMGLLLNLYQVLIIC